MSTLCLHAGARKVSYDELCAVATPTGTASHVPVPHSEIVELMRSTLAFHGHEIAEEAHGVMPDGARYFGLMTLRGSHNNPVGDYGDVVGLRNSHNKSFPIGIAFGSRVFVCDNMAFIGDHVIKRKHTAQVKRDLPGLFAEVVQPLQLQREAQHDKLLTYQQTDLTDEAADHAILTMHRQEVIGPQGISRVLKAWEEPPHDWGGRTAWRLFNAATFALAGKVAEKPYLTKKLHAIIDGTCEAVH